MIAESHGKKSLGEDKLTGDFFGSLRYLPFSKGIKPLLLRAKYSDGENVDISKSLIIDDEFWNSNILFWPTHKEAELDVMINLPDIVFGLEVKLASGLSSVDGDDSEVFKSPQKSMNQLARESRALSSLYPCKKKVLLLIGPEYRCVDIITNTDHSIISAGVVLGYLSWEELLDGLRELCTSKDDVNSFENLILKDLAKLLEIKGLARFTSFMVPLEVNRDEVFSFYIHDYSFDIKDSIDPRRYYRLEH